MDINWYPGHMAKAKRQIQQDLKNINIVIEILDARIPRASANPDFVDLFSGKDKLIILNKSDMADDRVTKEWLDYYQQQGIFALAFSSTKDNKKKVMDAIHKVSAPILEKYKAKGVNKTIRCMVAGIPNSGKSSFINRVFGGSKVKSEDRPGVTRANQWIKVGPFLEMLDTPGVLWPKFEDAQVAMNLSFVGSIKDKVLDVEELAGKLLEKLTPRYGENIIERYQIELDQNGYVMLEEICKKRGFIFGKNDYDYERGANILLDEFRAGKLGKISLEEPHES